MKAKAAPHHAQDYELVQSVIKGSRSAWHRFIREYADLIFHQINRYLAYGNEDDRREVFVSVLEELRKSGFVNYKGRAKLSTWLVCVVRNRSIDYLRRHHGRKAAPPWLKSLSDEHQAAYRWYFLEGDGLAAVYMRIRAGNSSFEMCDLAGIILDLEARMDSGVQRRLAFELQSRSVAGVSGRLLEYLQTLRAETEQKQRDEFLTGKLINHVKNKLLERIFKSVAALSPSEQAVIRVRVMEGKTAKATADALSLESQRLVYSLERKALRNLRKQVGENGE